jgi:cob(I)alamin adenosyltransferase
MPIYTKRGDEGETDLWNMERVSKTAPRVEAYGTVDECNTVVGLARPTGHDDLDDQLQTVQNDLHVVQADLANPDSTPGEDDAPGVTACVRPDHVERLETWIDTHQDTLPDLEDFVLPGGTEVAARLHQARAVCRRAERRTVAAAEADDIQAAPLQYLNRLSDYLFVLARVCNHREGVTEENPTY